MADIQIDRIRAEMRRLNIKLSDIERRTGITSRTLRYWLDGTTRHPDPSAVRMVLKTLGLDS